MAEKSSSSSTGLGLLEVLGVIFVTLKLCGVIDWSWWWVTSPFWVLGLFWGLVLLAVIVMAKRLH